MNIDLTWVNFKTVANSKSLKIQYTEDTQLYRIFALDGSIQYKTFIVKSDADPAITLSEGDITVHAAAQTDFETNYKNTSNQPLEFRSTDGLLKVAPSKFVETLDLYVDGENGLVSLTSGETKYCKTHYSTPYTLAGADVKWQSANYGDYIDFEVGVYTDINDEGTFISLNKFGNKYRILGDGGRLFDVPTVKVVPSTVTINGYSFDICIRAKCVNVGPAASKILINLIGWK